MGTPLGPKYILYTYMDPLGYSPGLSSSSLPGTVASAARTGDAPGAHSQHYRGYIRSDPFKNPLCSFLDSAEPWPDLSPPPPPWWVA